MTTALMEQSNEILCYAIHHYKPYAIVAMVSGGNDSMAALQVARECGVKIDALVHINTRTGIQETTEFVRDFADGQKLNYIEGDAGRAYEDYVDRKGFHGKGTQAHAQAYQLLKATNIRKAISRHFRHGKRKRNVLLLNGVMESESANRKRNYSGSHYDADPGAPSNIWVNHLWHWSKHEAREYIAAAELPRNPVVDCLHRSAECMCGTMQSEEDRRMAEFFFSAWGSWLRTVEQRAIQKHGWGWGESRPSWKGELQNGQVGMGDEWFMPMCRACQENPE